MKVNTVISDYFRLFYPGWGGVDIATVDVSGDSVTSTATDISISIFNLDL